MTTRAIRTIFGSGAIERIALDVFTIEIVSIVVMPSLIEINSKPLRAKYRSSYAHVAIS